MRTRTQLPWMANVQIGDLVGTSPATVRVVREVSRFPDGDLRCLTFIILRHSWTNKPYTVYNHTDLVTQGYKKYGKMKRMTSPIDIWIANAIAGRDDPKMTWADVMNCDVR